jgi:hypothetical protein
LIPLHPLSLILYPFPSMSDPSSQLTPAELQAWQLGIQEANRHNIFCHCRECDREWVASDYAACECGSTHVEPHPLLAVSG